MQVELTRGLILGLIIGVPVVTAIGVWFFTQPFKVRKIFEGGDLGSVLLASEDWKLSQGAQFELDDQTLVGEKVDQIEIPGGVRIIVTLRYRNK